MEQTQQTEQTATTNLLDINVNERVRQKNGLTYLSWAWAWQEALKHDPKATYKIRFFDGVPYCAIGQSAMVFVSVTIDGIERECQLPVLDYKNKSLPLDKLNSFDVNKAHMRCLAKAIGLHGLGLYIYAGEDLPEEEAQRQREEKAKQQAAKFDQQGYDQAMSAIAKAEDMRKLKGHYDAAITLYPQMTYEIRAAAGDRRKQLEAMVAA